MAESGTTPNNGILLLGVPTEAGTHFSGQAKAPKAIIKDAGLLDKLQSLGFMVTIDDAIVASENPELQRAAKYQPAPKVGGVRNEANTLKVLHAVRDRLVHLAAIDEDIKKEFVMAIGGDCTITPPILSALHTWHPPGTKIGLLYFDGDVDLTIPSQSGLPGSSGILDSMTMTHLTGREAGLKSMRAFSRPDSTPLVNSENIVLFGFDPLQPQPEHWTYLLEYSFKAFSRPTVQADPVGTARKALEWLGEKCDVLYVHFDVDCIDSGEFPLANYPHYAGLGVEEALSALGVFLGSPNARGLIVTEVNPERDGNGTMVGRLVEGIVEGMKGRL